MTISGRSQLTGFGERVYLILATPTHLPILRRWHAGDPELGRRLSGFYAEGDGWVKELVEHEERVGWIVYQGTDQDTEPGTEPVGFADLDVDRDAGLGHVSLYIARPARRSGFGTASLGLVAREAAKLGLSGMVANVQPDNVAAIRCLHKSGFSPLGGGSLGGLPEGSPTGEPTENLTFTYRIPGPDPLGPTTTT